MGEPAGAAACRTRARAVIVVAYAVRTDGMQLLAIIRSTGESPAAWEGLLHDLYRPGLEGRQLQLIVTDGGAELAAALQSVYPQVGHQRCWVHKLHNLLKAVRRRDHAAMRRWIPRRFISPRAEAES